MDTYNKHNVIMNLELLYFMTHDLELCFPLWWLHVDTEPLNVASPN